MPRPSPKLALRPFVFALLIAAPVVALAAGKPGPAKPAAAKQADPVVAVVDGSPIHRSDIIAEQQELRVEQVPIAQIYQKLLDRAIGLKLLTRAGRAEKLQDDPKVKEAMARLEDRVIAQTFLNQVEDKAVTDAELHQRYQAMLKTFKGEEQVHARHILLPTEAQAKEVIAELDKGADFSKLANEKSSEKDLDGGDLGWFGKDQMVPEFADAAFALQPGQYTKTPVKTKFGWHVIKVEARRVAPPPSFDEAKAQLAQDIAQDAANHEVASLKKKAKVQEFNFDGSPQTAATSTPLTTGGGAP